MVVIPFFTFSLSPASSQLLLDAVFLLSCLNDYLNYNLHFTGLQSGDLLWGGHWPWEARQQVTKPAFDRLETSDTLISNNENSHIDNQIARASCSGSLCGRCTRRRRIGRRAQNRISKQGIHTKLLI